MPTLVLSTWSLPASRALAGAARETGWRARAFDESPQPKPRGKVVFYGGTDQALTVAARYRLALLEPPFDLGERFVSASVYVARWVPGQASERAT